MILIVKEPDDPARYTVVPHALATEPECGAVIETSRGRFTCTRIAGHLADGSPKGMHEDCGSVELDTTEIFAAWADEA